jgi:hypothetical protein
MPLIKRNFLRYQTFESHEDLKSYIKIMTNINTSKQLRFICDDQVKSKMYLFFLQNKDNLSVKDFKNWAMCILSLKLYKNSDIYRTVEQGFVDKFLKEFDSFEVIDIVPICRNIFRGPEFDNPVFLAKLEEFLISNTKYIEKLRTNIGQNNDEVMKSLMFFEGACMINKTSR